MNKLTAPAWIALVVLIVVMGATLFFTAGTIRYWEAWVYLGVCFTASFLLTLYLIKKNPALLERRMRGGPAAEKEQAQKTIMLLASFGFIATLVASALDFRYHLSSVPLYVVIVGDILVALCFYIFFLAFKESAFSSATVEASAEQRVISSGPYAFVRHPTYAGGLLLFIGTPLALGSYWGLLAIVVMVPMLIWRLLDEDIWMP